MLNWLKYKFKSNNKFQDLSHIGNSNIETIAKEKFKFICKTLLSTNGKVKVDLMSPVDFSNFIFDFYKEYSSLGFDDKKSILDHIKKIAEFEKNVFAKRYFLEVHQNNMLKGYRENEKGKI